MMFAKRIVVTGVGAMTPVGQDVGSSWQALLDGRSGVGPIAGFEAEGARPPYAAEVKDFTPERAGVPRRKLKMMGRQAQLAFAAAEQACADAGLNGDAEHVDPTRLGIILGVGMLNADALELGRTCNTMAGEVGTGFETSAFMRAAATELFPLWLLRHIRTSQRPTRRSISMRRGRRTRSRPDASQARMRSARPRGSSRAERPT